MGAATNHVSWLTASVQLSRSLRPQACTAGTISRNWAVFARRLVPIALRKAESLAGELVRALIQYRHRLVLWYADRADRYVHPASIG